MAKKKGLPDGWTLTVEVEPADGVPGSYKAFRTIDQGTYELATDSLEGLVAAAEDYDRNYAQHQAVWVQTGPASSEGR